MSHGRRERLAALLARENEKSALPNRLVSPAGLGEPKLRDLKLSATDRATGNSKAPTPVPRQFPPKTVMESSLKKTTSRSVSQRNTPLSESKRMEELTLKSMNASQPRSQAPSQQSRRSQAPSEQKFMEPPPLKPLLRPKGEWTLLRQFESELCTADQAMRSKLQQKEVKEHRAFLDQQRAEKEAMMMMMREQAQREAQHQEEDIRRFQMEEKAKRDARAAIEERHKKEAEETLIQLRKERQAERDRIRQQEEDAVQLAKRQLDLERDVQRKRKAEREAKMKEDMLFMDQQIKVKAEQKAELAEKDRKQMEEYQRLLAEQEAARESAMAAMYEKMMARSAIAGAGAVADRADRVKREEEFLKAQLQAAEERAQKEEREKEERRQRLNNEQLEVLAKQAREKKEKAVREKAEKLAFQDQLRQKQLLEKEAEEAEEKARRERNIKHKMHLIRQMHENQDKLDPGGSEEAMTTQELLINAPLVSRAKEVLGDDI